MPFDFRTHANKLAEQKAAQQRDEIQKRDRNNAIARDIVQGLMAHYAGQLGSEFVRVEGAVATVSRQDGGSLSITVLGENEFTAKEKGGTAGFRDPKLHDNLQKDRLDKTAMMDTIVEWFAEG